MRGREADPAETAAVLAILTVLAERPRAAAGPPTVRDVAALHHPTIVARGAGAWRRSAWR